MKIICVGMNYAKHNEELAHSIGEIQGVDHGNPTLFLKPDTALTRADWPFFVPDWSNQVEYETELVVRINRLGKSIPERFAHRYYDELTLGIDFTARDLQRELKAKGLPWELSKGFDGSAYCGQTWLRVADLPHGIQDLHFEMQLNGTTRQIGWTGDMLHTVDQIIAYASRFFLLKTGDLIFTGTPTGVGTVKEDDILVGSIEGQQVMECRVK